MSGRNRPNQDIPVSVALILLGGIAFALAAASAKTEVSSLVSMLDQWTTIHPALTVLTALALLANFGSTILIFENQLSANRQGVKLKALTGSQKRKFPIREFRSFLCWFFGFFLVHCLMLLSSNAATFGSLGFSLLGTNNALASAIFCETVKKLLARKSRANRDRPLLADEPCGANSLSLGTSSDGLAEGFEQWVSISGKALNGNVLITGSIGSGKTQGTILPYFNQILRNCSPKPAVLAIDPKGNFAVDAMKIAELHQLQDRMLHLRLNGDVTFNPIFANSPLKDGKYIQIAQMIRTAAVNFSGRGSGDSPFWELSSFNLTKNSLAYCAAVLGYFTLNDLYKAMLDAADDKLASRLEDVLRSDSLDDEEKHNARQALAYFTGEFSNFDQKLKTGILATATSFLGQFQEFKTSRVFCPPAEGRTIEHIDSLIDEQKILIFDVTLPGLSRALGTLMKLLFQQSVLERLSSGSRSRAHPALLLMDEYQEIASSGYGSLLGDDRFLAKGREANAITIAATQSFSSLENSFGRSTAAKELIQNFRTRIACHSNDHQTITSFQELVGEEEKRRTSHGFSEVSQNARKSLITGGFESANGSISESISTSIHKEAIVTGKDFARLNSFEALGLVYDGIKTNFFRLKLKPYFLEKRNTLHRDLLQRLASVALLFTVGIPQAKAFPNVCDVVNASEFSSCMGYKVTSCVCPGIPPRPCARFTYYLPETYVEVTSDSNNSLFKDLAGAKTQLTKVRTKIPYGTDGDDFSAFQARTLGIPLSSTVFPLLACGYSFQDMTCFGAMSEHLGSNWSTGLPDAKQPNFLLGAASPKTCLMVGAAKSSVGGATGAAFSGSPACSVPRQYISIYPPSTHEACNGWGSFYPRVGHYDGPSQTTGALMVASRMKSLSSEVFQSAESSPEEKWQMIYPNATQCFNEGQNVGFLESAARVNELGRFKGRKKDYLFVVWKKYSCCRDLWEAPTSQTLLSAVKSTCEGLGVCFDTKKWTKKVTLH